MIFHQSHHKHGIMLMKQNSKIYSTLILINSHSKPSILFHSSHIYQFHSKFIHIYKADFQIELTKIYIEFLLITTHEFMCMTSNMNNQSQLWKLTQSLTSNMNNQSQRSIRSQSSSSLEVCGRWSLPWEIRGQWSLYA